MTDSDKERAARIKSAIALRRLTVRAWAKKHRFPEKTVYAVISGGRTGARNPRLVAALNRLAA